MTLANYNANQLWLQIVKNQQKINVLVVVLLVIFLLAYAAELTWRLWPVPKGESTTDTATVQAAPIQNNNNRLNLASIKRLNLFGDLTAKPVEEEVVTDAPVTRLNLTLTGVVTSTEEDQGAAIIENRNQQQTYGIGEKIDGTNASLKAVYADRVIIKNGPASETLMLDGVDYSKTVHQPNRQTPTAPSTQELNKYGPQRRTLSSEALQASKLLRQKPANFTDFIAISPHRPNGRLVGYRVSPGKDTSLFKAAGLLSGDVITEINGLDLSDIKQAYEATNMLKNLESLQMLVQRKEEILTIYLDLPNGEEEL